MSRPVDINSNHTKLCPSHEKWLASGKDANYCVRGSQHPQHSVYSTAFIAQLPQLPQLQRPRLRPSRGPSKVRICFPRPLKRDGMRMRDCRRGNDEITLRDYEAKYLDLSAALES